MGSDRPAAPLLAAKQAIPILRAGTIHRDRLESQLRTADTPLTLVVAPAGWGKTTLLSTWARGDPEVRVAWVSLDENDDEPVRFWRYVLSALQASSDAISPAPLEALLTPGLGPLDLAVPLLLNELAATAVPHAIVLDDFHLIENRSVHEEVEYLLAYLPPPARLIVGSRQDPPLPIARLRARGQLTELRADDLRFEPAEAEAMVTELVGADIGPSAATSAWTRTEGWAAGLQLVALAQRTRTQTPGAGQPGDRHLLDYFAAEVLPALTPEEHDLLLGTAHLDRLSGPLCDAALGTTGSAARLDRLDAESLFVVALDPERVWFRCHHLFRDALLRTITAAGPEAADQREVLRRAAQWYADHELWDDAVRALLRAEDAPAAAALLESAEFWFFNQGLAASYLALGDALPPSAVSVQLALALTYAAETCGRRDRVLAWLDVAQAGLTPAATVRDWRSARAAVVMLRGLVGTTDAEGGKAVALTREALDEERAAGEPHPQTALLAVGLALARDGQMAEAATVLDDCWREREEAPWTRPVLLQFGGLLALCLAQLERDDELVRLLRQARPLVEEAEEAWGPVADPLVMLLRAAEGRHRYRAGRFDDARAILARAAATQARVSPSARVMTLVYLADAELAAGERAAARSTLRQARDVAAEEPVAPYTIEQLEQAEIRMGRGALKAATHAGVLLEDLTDRELAILRTLPGTASQREIGAALYLSINTIKAYNKNLYRKLGVNSRHEAVTVARRLGLI